jgi:HD superfamily phosphohydrolase
MEYHLKEIFGWHHEEVPAELLAARQAPENVAHQMFAGRTTQFRQELKRSGIDRDLVRVMLLREHPLSQLIFGTLDLDNLDNVARMAHGLGDASGRSTVEAIAAHLDVDKRGLLKLPRSFQPYVAKWLALRRFSYETLSFDGPTIAAQAILWRAIERGLDNGLLAKSDWDLSDEDLLGRLSIHRRSRREISMEYLGNPPSLLMALQLSVSLEELGAASRPEIVRNLEDLTAQAFSAQNPIAYVVLDNKTFNRRLTFHDSEGPWSEGEDSRSTILYVFLRSMQRLQSWRLEEFRATVLRTFNVSSDRIIRCKFGSDDGPDAQSKLDLQTA